MAYDEDLAERIRRALDDVPGLEERHMFGGIAFMVNGHMACGVVRSQMMVRVGADAYERTLEERHVAPMTFTGKALEGFVYVEPSGLGRPEQVARWAQRGVEHARSLPPKKPKKQTKSEAPAPVEVTPAIRKKPAVLAKKPAIHKKPSIKKSTSR
ncbi:MAG: TfoX/Sxy family protein [Myxococcota bacterium]|nr:TfoX/Sxy family protein [Myxococcota bacterium]